MTITIKFEDGSISYANGTDAQQIMSWWQFCETHVLGKHGVAKYTGPPLKRITCITQADETSLTSLSVQDG